MKDFEFKINSTGEQITVSLVSFKEMSDLYGHKAALPLVYSCGFATSYTTQEQLDAVKVIYAGDDQALAAIETAKVGHSVTVMTDIDHLLSRENSEAIFMHELGHVVHGHVKTALEGLAECITFESTSCKFLSEEAMEIEADAYAASFVGYHRVLAALNAVVKARAVIAVQLGISTASVEEVEADTMAQIRSTLRYQELLKYTEGY